MTQTNFKLINELIAQGYKCEFINQLHNIEWYQEQMDWIKQCYKNKDKFIIPMYSEASIRTINNQTDLILKLCNNDVEYIKNNVILWCGSTDDSNVKGTIWEGITIYGPYLASWSRGYFNNNLKHDVNNKTKTFLCFNRVLRPHRVKLVADLVERDMLDNNYISFFKNQVHSKTNNDQYKETINFHFSKQEQQKIISTLSSFEGDLYIDDIDPGLNQASTRCPTEFYETSFFSLVTETMFFEDDPFFSEKIFKPIVFKQPFVLVCQHLSVAKLKGLGFRVFDKWFDLSYDNMAEPLERMNAIVAELVRIESLPLQKKREMFEEMREDCEYNYKLLTENVEELVYKHSNIRSFL